MLSRIQLEDMSFDDLKDLVRASELTIPQHANKEKLVDQMVDFYATRQKEIAEKNQEATTFTATQTTTAATPAKKGRYNGYDTAAEYKEAMMTPVLCIITPQSSEFARQDLASSSVSVGNALVPNREFAFTADGSTVTAIPRIAVNRIKEMRVLTRGTTKLDKNKMSGNLQGSGFGRRFSVYELNAEEIEEYRAAKAAKAKAQAATGVGL